ncbi:hypothetical protein EOE67_04060 [Rheinheimera riviphila]|uniref:Uncharacterized protein n=1 Tax=Rheinheimera riviphila TaxID=1834037 RepID=A0A437R1X6_9GAMM|nr:hypothetical protein [Rheinheimera riviphila]RVU40760.1 hypothetical protein EOE67_04060 [Rheinheimera riviphila]
MYRLFSNASNLRAVFGSYSTVEALRVKSNIDLVTRRLKIPSRALLEQMKQEGISLTDFEQKVTSEADWSMMSETVLRSHLRAAFLDEIKLYDALAALSLSQQADIRDVMLDVVSFLHLPSETLLRRMQDEGLTLDKLGVKQAAISKIDAIRDKLNSLNQQSTAQQSSPTSHPDDSIASLKQRIQQLKNQPAETEHNESQVPLNVVALARLREKLKA